MNVFLVEPHLLLIDPFFFSATIKIVPLKCSSILPIAIQAVAYERLLHSERFPPF